jgi:protein SCO1/2
MFGLAACGAGEPRFRSTDITGANYGRTLELRDTTGRQRSLSEFKGKVVLLFFGFTQCPDVCPTTLGQVSQALKQLGADAARVQVIFVTLDPERDTASLLGQYLVSFDPGFVGLRGDLDATRAAAKEFKVFFERRAGSSPERYSIDHSSQTYVIDAKGRLRLFVRHERLGEDLAPDIRMLLREPA